MNTVRNAAFKNPFGEYEIVKFSIFKINELTDNFLSMKAINIFQNKVELKVECPICGENHYYTYNINEFMKRGMIIGGCEVLGFPIFFIGDPSKVEDKVKKYIEVNRKIYAMI